ncbi:hypothetical protein [Capnocytophaga catalasegens]|uniref:Uncharacterized protein n=1 Tax=Capnocytophaga catalasegens TaxID=1004260 RepID=A0AAV5AV07_9FLAO|nr:hypothetical protein [Capnocytophaga catalasegens]GIZ15304.1 hypothetical protein RCZ03_13040 [Capnocytophaga catalasegens]GJM51238.1 hypothetical protein RCZ15_22110 [Capnocytophaga catalasegens]GJM53032.1 hypothetical protein RCZ16_13490 [Capnocytophaga catalasegens]
MSEQTTEVNSRIQANALIRANFHIDPEGLQLSQWTRLYCEALWIEKWRLQNQAELFKALFSG